MKINPTTIPLVPISLLKLFLFLRDFISPIEDKIIPIKPQGNRLSKNKPKKIIIVSYIFSIEPAIINNTKDIGGIAYNIKAGRYILYIFIFIPFIFTLLSHDNSYTFCRCRRDRVRCVRFFSLL